jgi:DNA polymerase
VRAELEVVREMHRRRVAPMKSSASSKTAPPPAEPVASGLDDLREQVRACQGCDLWQRATQAVFGEGPADARVMLVGEQPGDSEDVEGRPFVGPAGRILGRAIVAAGLDRSRIYVTNAVKHFKWVPAPRGKRRLHSKPNAGEIHACRPWLEGEIAAVEPSVVVCLGASAARALLGPRFRVSDQRGVWIPSPLPAATLATVHPSSILRERDDDRRHEAFARFVADLTVVRERVAPERAR